MGCGIGREGGERPGRAGFRGAWCGSRSGSARTGAGGIGFMQPVQTEAITTRARALARSQTASRAARARRIASASARAPGPAPSSRPVPPAPVCAGRASGGRMRR